jgi:hypothetical protein
MEVSERIMKLVTEKGLSEFDAWNRSTMLLINVAKVKFFEFLYY